MVAAELSAIGVKVLVVEKSTYFTRAEMSGAVQFLRRSFFRDDESEEGL